MTNDYCLSRLLTDLSFLVKDGCNLLEFIIQFKIHNDSRLWHKELHNTSDDYYFHNKKERNGN